MVVVDIGDVVVEVRIDDLGNVDGVDEAVEVSSSSSVISSFSFSAINSLMTFLVLVSSMPVCLRLFVFWNLIRAFLVGKLKYPLILFL